ncbi:MAG: COG1361 S-layer family protein [Thermoplasmatota archaeon]
MAKGGRWLVFAALGVVAVGVWSALPTVAAVPIQFTATPTPTVNLPGSQGVLLVTLMNRGTQVLTDLTLTVDATTAGLDFNTTTVDWGSLAPNSTKSAQFPYDVPATAAAGFYSLRATVDGISSSSGVYDVTYATVTVRSPAALAITAFDPNRLDPGEQATANVTFSNVGSGPLSNIVAIWTSPGNALLPLDRSNTLQVPNLDGQTSATLSFRMAASSTAPRGVNSILFQLSYNDQTGAHLNSTFVVGILLGGPTTLQVAIQNVTSEAVTVEVANVGLNAATAVVLQPQDSHVLAGGPAFLGNLNPGDARSASFHAVADLGGASLSFQLEYTDPLGVRHAQLAVAPWLGRSPGPAVTVNVQNVDSNTVTVAVTDVGSEPVSGVEVHLVTAFPFSVTGADTVALGNLMPGNFLTADFEVHRNGDPVPGAVSAQLSYTDRLGNRRTETQPLDLASLALTYSLPTWGVVAITAGVILAAEGAIAGVVAVRRKRKAVPEEGPPEPPE